MRHSMFFKIYLTVVATVLVVAMFAAALIWFGQSQGTGGNGGPFHVLLMAALPPPEDVEGTRAALARIGVAVHADIAVFDEQGRIIAHVGEPLTFVRPGVGRSSSPEVSDTFVSQLGDGRVLLVRYSPRFAPGPIGPLGLLAGIASLAAIVAWLVVRQITGRLGDLRDGVKAWGAGDLSRRVSVSGQDELAAVAVSFNRAAEQLEQMVISHKTLLANASHELRSPLARLGMAVHLYQAKPDDTTRLEIDRNLKELDSLVEEILLASRLQHSEGFGPHLLLDLMAIVAEEGARHNVEVSGESTMIDGDARLLTRLVRNLMHNAVIHGAPPFSAVVERIGSAVELSVRDHGTGIGENGDRLFEPFYRPADRAEAAGGWGLGLALVRQIASLHGATVRHVKPDGDGACFVVSFRLPRTSGAFPEDDRLGISVVTKNLAVKRLEGPDRIKT